MSLVNALAEPLWYVPSERRHVRLTPDNLFERIKIAQGRAYRCLLDRDDAYQFCRVARLLWRRAVETRRVEGVEPPEVWLYVDGGTAASAFRYPDTTFSTSVAIQAGGCSSSGLAPSSRAPRFGSMAASSPRASIG